MRLFPRGSSWLAVLAQFSLTSSLLSSASSLFSSFSSGRRLASFNRSNVDRPMSKVPYVWNGNDDIVRLEDGHVVGHQSKGSGHVFDRAIRNSHYMMPASGSELYDIPRAVSSPARGVNEYDSRYLPSYPDHLALGREINGDHYQNPNEKSRLPEWRKMVQKRVYARRRANEQFRDRRRIKENLLVVKQHQRVDAIQQEFGLFSDVLQG